MYACVYETGSGLFDGLCKQENRLLTFRNSLLDSRIDSGRRTLVVASVWVLLQNRSYGLSRMHLPAVWCISLRSMRQTQSGGIMLIVSTRRRHVSRQEGEKHVG
jgi:hypothetical protein